MQDFLCGFYEDSNCPQKILGLALKRVFTLTLAAALLPTTPLCSGCALYMIHDVVLNLAHSSISCDEKNLILNITAGNLPFLFSRIGGRSNRS